MSGVWAMIFLAAGLVCLFQGYKIYKTVTVVLALSIGAFAGYYLGKKIHAEYVVAGCLAVLTAVSCFPLMKYAVSGFRRPGGRIHWRQFVVGAGSIVGWSW